MTRAHSCSLKIAPVSGSKKIIGLAQRNPLPYILLELSNPKKPARSTTPPAAVLGKKFAQSTPRREG
jgi:hypothetical protein